jgi:hypothetical protein
MNQNRYVVTNYHNVLTYSPDTLYYRDEMLEPCLFEPYAITYSVRVAAAVYSREEICLLET